MTDYDAFAAVYDGDAGSAFDGELPEQSVLGDPPALDDATWDSMLDAAYDAPASAEAGGGIDLLAEFAASITGIIDGFGDAMAGLFGVDGDDVHEEAAFEGVDLDGDGIADDFDGDGIADALEAGDTAADGGAGHTDDAGYGDEPLAF